MIIERMFLPVGQGAFYLEKHPDMNVIYDCGNLHKTKRAQKIVSQTLTNKDDIDILFISHFDYDHVSLISTLKKSVNKIKKVVLPLLSGETKSLLININRAVGNDTLRLIKEPSTFFDKDTKIIYISAEYYNRDGALEIDIDSIDNESTQPRGVILKSSLASYDWAFIPFNHKRAERQNSLEDELIKNGFDVLKLKEDPEYTVDASINSASRKKLKDIYNKLSGKINENSMLIYSGPTKQNFYGNYIESNATRMIFPLFRRLNVKYYPFVNAKCGCIYTGDSDLNKTAINSVFANVIDKVGVIQIPHHGDISSYNSHTFKTDNFVCPISYGTKNTYGHPSTRVISDLLANECWPIHITEDVDSYFIQHIEI